ncbi:MAG: hypothetical protein ACI9LY_000703 [Arenicella sp.]|jgi:hypothetical protein
MTYLPHPLAMRKTRYVALLVLSIAHCNIHADDLLDRLELATEQIGAKQGAFYLSRIPSLADKMPDWNWDDEIREASSCVLTGIEKAKGRRVAQAYVSGLEKDAIQTYDSVGKLSDQSNTPKELLGSDQTISNLLQACKMIDISAARLKESGMWDELLKPEVMAKLVEEQQLTDF